MIALVVAFASEIAARSVQTWFPFAVSQTPFAAASGASDGLFTVNVTPRAVPAATRSPMRTLLSRASMRRSLDGRRPSREEEVEEVEDVGDVDRRAAVHVGTPER